MHSSTSSPWIVPNNSNLTTNNSNCRSNGGSRKRKAAVSDLDEKVNQKMFITEEKMVKEMQTLSLELAALNNNNNNNIPSPTPEIKEETSIDDIQTDEEDSNHEKEIHLELHKLLKDSLKNDNFQDSLINKLCEIERKKFTMQIVPYMPIHPAQLNNDTITITTNNKTKDEEETIENAMSSDESTNENNDPLFKIPSIPTRYTVEEPCDSTIKRAPPMKRSYSQSDQYNSNLSVTELKSDGTDCSSIHQPESAYFIVEPTTTSLSQTLSNTSSSSLSSGGSSVRITEFIENPTINNEFTNTLDDDDIDMQSVASSDAGDKMDDD